MQNVSVTKSENLRTEEKNVNYKAVKVNWSRYSL
jgi:hypothetical protein